MNLHIMMAAGNSGTRPTCPQYVQRCTNARTAWSQYHSCVSQQGPFPQPSMSRQASRSGQQDQSEGQDLQHPSILHCKANQAAARLNGPLGSSAKNADTQALGEGDVSFSACVVANVSLLYALLACHQNPCWLNTKLRILTPVYQRVQQQWVQST